MLQILCTWQKERPHTHWPIALQKMRYLQFSLKFSEAILGCFVFHQFNKKYTIAVWFFGQRHKYCLKWNSYNLHKPAPGSMTISWFLIDPYNISYVVLSSLYSGRWKARGDVWFRAVGKVFTTLLKRLSTILINGEWFFWT